MEILENIFDLHLEGKNLFIVGKPASGKTFISNLLSKRFKKHLIIRTDNYITLENQLKEELRNIVQQKRNYILEGNQGYSLLKSLEKSDYPDIILELSVSDDQVKAIYQNERELNKLFYALAYHHHHKKEFSKFLETKGMDIPYYVWTNSFSLS